MDVPQVEGTASGPSNDELISLDLEAMTRQVVSLFQQGRGQDALERSVAFSLAAKASLGERNATYINSLATVAALSEQLGGSEEADVLLMEAVELQEEMNEDTGGETSSLESQKTEDFDGTRESVNSSDADSDWDAEGEAEAQVITKLTIEVNELLREGLPEKAALLLSEVEKGFTNTVSSVCQAAFHTLWAAVLEAIGESEKARCLYDEAMHCLAEEVGALISGSSTSDGGSFAGDYEDSEQDSQRSKGTAREQETSSSLASTLPAPDTPAVPTVVSKPTHHKSDQSIVDVVEKGVAASSSPSPPPSQDTVKAATTAVRVPTVKPGPKHRPRPKVRARARTQAVKSAQPKEPADRVEAQPVAVPPDSQVTRTHEGGGFFLTEGPSGDRVCEAGEANVVVDTDSPPAEGTTCSDGPVVTAGVHLTPEKVEEAMTCADHYVGLLNFGKAADKLEEQLLALVDSPHRHSDIHVDCLLQYAKILEWDADPDSAVDALTAADEILTERPKEPSVQERRIGIWMKLAQVHRECGDFETADEHLSDAVCTLQDLLHTGDVKRRTLQEAQAALAQVCVERKEYERAEELYSRAYGMKRGQGSDSESDGSP